MQQTLDDSDLLAANLDAASIKQQVNSDAMKEADNAEDMSGECPICFDPYRDRVVCPCPGAHAFCRHCLQGVQTLQCPVCRDSSAEVARWVFLLQADAAMIQEQLFEVLQSGTVEVVQFLCQTGPTWTGKRRTG